MAKTPEDIATRIAGTVEAYSDSAAEVGDAEGQPLIETFPRLRELLAQAAREAQTPPDTTRYGIHPDGIPRVKPRYYGHGRLEQNGEWRRTVPTVMDRDDGSLVAEAVSATIRDQIVDSLNAEISSTLEAAE